MNTQKSRTADGSVGVNSHEGISASPKVSRRAGCLRGPEEQKCLDAGLMEMSFAGNWKEVVRLLKAGADVDAKDGRGMTALTNALEGGHMALFEFLLENGFGVDAESAEGKKKINDAMLKAAENHEWKNAVTLLKAGADVDARDRFGRSMLHFASRQKDLELVGWLIGKGADVNATDIAGDTVLMKAAYAGDMLVTECPPEYPGTVELLLRKGVDVNAKNKNGRTALMGASCNGSSKVVDMLIKNGADVNAKDAKGRTALIESSWSKLSIATSRALVANGADVNAKDVGGQTVLEIASANANDACVELLKEHGAQE